MPDETGLRGLLMSMRSSTNRPKTGADVNLPDENPKRKKKGFVERFKASRPEADQAAIEQLQKAIKGGQR